MDQMMSGDLLNRKLSPNCLRITKLLQWYQIDPASKPGMLLLDGAIPEEREDDISSWCREAFLHCILQVTRKTRFGTAFKLHILAAKAIGVLSCQAVRSRNVSQATEVEHIRTSNCITKVEKLVRTLVRRSNTIVCKTSMELRELMIQYMELAVEFSKTSIPSNPNSLVLRTGPVGTLKPIPATFSTKRKRLLLSRKVKLRPKSQKLRLQPISSKKRTTNDNKIQCFQRFVSCSEASTRMAHHNSSCETQINTNINNFKLSERCSNDQSNLSGSYSETDHQVIYGNQVAVLDTFVTNLSSNQCNCGELLGETQKDSYRNSATVRAEIEQSVECVRPPSGSNGIDKVIPRDNARGNVTCRMERRLVAATSTGLVLTGSDSNIECKSVCSGMSEILAPVDAEESEVLETVDAGESEVLESVDTDKSEVLEPIDTGKSEVLETIDSAKGEETLFAGLVENEMEIDILHKSTGIPNKSRHSWRQMYCLLDSIRQNRIPKAPPDHGDNSVSAKFYSIRTKNPISIVDNVKTTVKLKKCDNASLNAFIDRSLPQNNLQQGKLKTIDNDCDITCSTTDAQSKTRTQHHTQYRKPLGQPHVSRVVQQIRAVRFSKVCGLRRPISALPLTRPMLPRVAIGNRPHSAPARQFQYKRTVCLGGSLSVCNPITLSTNLREIRFHKTKQNDAGKQSSSSDMTQTCTWNTAASRFHNFISSLPKVRVVK